MVPDILGGQHQICTETRCCDWFICNHLQSVSYIYEHYEQEFQCILALVWFGRVLVCGLSSLSIGRINLPIAAIICFRVLESLLKQKTEVWWYASFGPWTPMLWNLQQIGKQNAQHSWFLQAAVSRQFPSFTVAQTCSYSKPLFKACSIIYSFSFSWMEEREMRSTLWFCTISSTGGRARWTRTVPCQCELKPIGSLRTF